MNDMNEITSYELIRNFDELKGALNTELNKAAISFVRIGYLLKTARDTEVLKESAYADVNDFAAAEFGLDKSQVSRFIRINDRFSIGGYSEHLKVDYQEYGSAKLSLMLTLPDEINEELSPDFSKSDIQAIKEEYDEEQKITDIEVILEPKAEEPAAGGIDEFIAAIVKELNDEHPEPMERLHFENTAKDLNYLMDDLQEAYMPDGDRVYNIRISGQGRFMVSMKEEGIMIVNMRNPSEKSPLSWNEFMAAVIDDEEHRTFTEPKKEKPKQTEQKKLAKVERSTASKSKSNRENKGFVEKEESENSENKGFMNEPEAVRTGENAPSGDLKEEESGEENEKEIAEESRDSKPAAGPERIDGEVLQDRTYEQLLKTTHAERKLAMDAIENLWEMKDRLDENERTIQRRTMIEMRDLSGRLLHALEDITECCEFYEKKDDKEEGDEE